MLIDGAGFGGADGVPDQQGPMKRILFVEDNAMLRDMFHVVLSNEHERWEVGTAASGEEALELIKHQTFDVVASDMHMPGMNGVELLKEVMNLYPGTSRIIISGAADHAAAAEAMGSTHQFIMKPIDVNTLRSTLACLEGLDAFLKGDRLRTLAGKMRVLPSFPALYLEIMKAIEKPDTPLQTIDDLIVKDPGLTAKILQIVNSAAMGLQEKVNNPMEAVQQLGLGTVKSLALSAHVFTCFSASLRMNFPINALWNHLMQTGNTARAIMRAEDGDNAYVEAAYTAGLLHDVGKLMLADSLPKEFQIALTLAMESQKPLPEVEMEIFGATHAGLAAYLLGLWGLPAPIVEAVAFHHTPGRSTNMKFSPLTAVHAANALEHELDGEDSDVNLEYLERIGVADRLDTWREEAEKLRTVEK
jgi:HD-like signal output (HDOD) protein/ActR/RegA family two-component response regulator